MRQASSLTNKDSNFTFSNNDIPIIAMSRDVYVLSMHVSSLCYSKLARLFVDM